MMKIERNLPRLGFVIVMIGALLLNFASPPLQLVGVAIFLVVLLHPILELLIDKAIEQYEDIVAGVRYRRIKRIRDKYLRAQFPLELMEEALSEFAEENVETRHRLEPRYPVYFGGTEVIGAERRHDIILKVWAGPYEAREAVREEKPDVWFIPTRTGKKAVEGWETADSLIAETLLGQSSEPYPLIGRRVD